MQRRPGGDGRRDGARQEPHEGGAQAGGGSPVLGSSSWVDGRAARAVAMSHKAAERRSSCRRTDTSICPIGLPSAPCSISAARRPSSPAPDRTSVRASLAPLAAQGATVHVNDIVGRPGAAAPSTQITAAGGTAAVASFDVTDYDAVTDAIDVDRHRRHPRQQRRERRCRGHGAHAVPRQRTVGLDGRDQREPVRRPALLACGHQRDVRARLRSRRSRSRQGPASPACASACRPTRQGRAGRSRSCATWRWRTRASA